jgi:serine/threonine protein kinase
MTANGCTRATDTNTLLRRHVPAGPCLAGLRPPVIHRDIKPENVVVEGGKWGGRVYLIDFGGVQGSSGLGGWPG